jgi:hypothetical protein
MATDQRSPIRLDTIATFVGVAAGLLPVAGFLVRYVAFLTGLGVGNVTLIALASPIGVLAWTGFSAFATYSPTILFVPFIGWLHDRTTTYRLGASQRLRDADALVADTVGLRLEIERTDPAHFNRAEMEARLSEISHRAAELEVLEAKQWQRVNPAIRLLDRLLIGLELPGWLFPLLAVAIQVVFFVFIYEWPFSLIPLLGWLIVFSVLPWWISRAGRLTPSLAAFVVTISLVFSAVGTGLSGNVQGQAAGMYVFKTGTGVQDGSYDLLGTSAQDDFLVLCGTKQTISVSPDEVAHVVWNPYKSPPIGPSLWSIIHDGKHALAGYRPNC